MTRATYGGHLLLKFIQLLLMSLAQELHLSRLDHSLTLAFLNEFLRVVLVQLSYSPELKVPDTE